MSHFCGIHYVTSKQQRDFIVLDKVTDATHKEWPGQASMVCTESITFPGGFQQAKNRKKWRERDRKTMTA